MINLGDSTQVTYLKNLVSNSFLCGSSSYGTGCLDCHPSCNGCTAGICNACTAFGATKSADGAVCLCNSGTGGTSKFHTSCFSCHPNCSTCEISSSPDSCKSCAVKGASVAPHKSSSSCECRAGYVPNAYPVGACTPCAPAGCPYCIGSDESQCMSPEQHELAKIMFIALPLPITTETAGHLICYRTPLPTSGCTPDPIESVTGPIVDYATVAQPTSFQCYSLLKAQWPWVNYWFDHLFPDFEGPLPISYTNFILIKTYLKLWILQFGPSEMDTWTDIKAAINGAGENWKNYIGWYDSNPGFSTDAGVTVHPFPAKLLASLQAGGATGSNMEIQVFNRESKVCADSSCSSTIKGYCLQTNSFSACANS